MSNIRDVYGVDSAQQLYEMASNFGINVGSMDKLIRFALELQRRAVAAQNEVNKEKAA